MRLTSVLLFLLTTWGNAYCQVAQRTKATVIDSLLSSCYEQGIFNGVALVADKGKVILHRSYGTADLKEQTPLKLSDRFYIGSLSKQFTSVLILQLQEAGFIDIADPISVYLSEFQDTSWAAITVHQLLTHTSGLGSYTSHPTFDKAIPYSDKELFDLIKQPLLFRPGTDWAYSNSGYFLLGKIGERITGKEYGTLLSEQIFEPLAMNNSSFSEEWLSDDLAKGYWRSVEGVAPMPTYSLLSLFSSGGIYSTAGDLFIWTQALDGDKLLSESSRKILYQPIINDYACGLYVKRGVDDSGNEFERHFHGGIMQGYHSFILKRIPQKQTIILLDNFYNQEIQTIKNRIWSALIEEEVRVIKPKLSNPLFEACAKNAVASLLDSISENLDKFEEQFLFEEFDINTVGYRLMAAKRYTEAKVIFEFNLNRYPDSWNVYDSMGELQLEQGNYEEAERLYKKSLTLNPKSDSAVRALKLIKLHTTK